ncbi:Hypothetical predicted protein [Paramuricea clavata]|uniref:Uncharacterized protein n=1 Tax=Paramuricea clavata TaxID=317549 RepID=A0A6S7GWA6_PARCT|nr:Hypothetical predicted protein [Paramuricea clavata]
MVRSNCSSKFLTVREEALHWAEEDEKLRPTKRNVSSEAVSTTQSNKEMDKVLQALEEQHPTIIFSGIREEEAAEAPPSVALTKEGTEFVLNAKESDTLQEIV